LLNSIKEGNGRTTDLNLLRHVKDLSWLSTAEMTNLVDGLAMGNFKKNEIILGDARLVTEAYILLSGVANISCLNAKSERVIVALIPPGPIPDFPFQPNNRWHFQCEAYSNCRLGSLSWDAFNVITTAASRSAFSQFHQSNLTHWYRLLMRGSSLLSIGLHERLGMTLLELCSDFGIEDSRGTLLIVVFSHQDLASLVGASRPRVTEHLAQLEREHLVFRQGRQLIVNVGLLENSMGVHSN
jgi:CRP/FNR family cyclic AMP-dependent transcriptional regulator